MHRSATSPGARADAVAFVLIAVAVLARAQFFALFLVLPAALVLHRLQSDRSLRGLLSSHRFLLGAYALLAAAAIALAAFGRLSSVLGTYSGAAANVAPSGIGRAVLDHLAVTALATGLLPFLVGGAWFLATLARPSAPQRHAFAWIAVLALVAVVFEVTSFDLRFGAGTVIDRYLFYVVPLFLVAFAGALTETKLPRWSLLVPTAVAVVVFVHTPLPRYPKLNVDRPLAATYGALVWLAGSVRAAHVTLMIGVVVVTVLLLLAPSLMRGRTLAALLVVLTSAAFAAETGGAFSKLFATAGSGSRPGSLAEAEFFAWIDKALDTGEKVTMVPFPLVVQNYAADVAYWWDTEFWNKSVDRDLVLDGAYSWTPKTFPKQSLRLDPTSGRANVSPSDYVVQAVGDTRFHIATSPGALAYRGAALGRAQQPWRADWVTSGLFEDGWTRPGVTATLKVFATPGQTAPLERFVTLAVRTTPDAKGAISVSSNADRWRQDSLPKATEHQVAVCVPAHGFGLIDIASPTRTLVYGDPTTVDSYARAARFAGVLITSISLADETGRC
jgi:hypothetical protein